jgi:hypothetical protein
MLWLSDQDAPDDVAELVHSRHIGIATGFELDSAWLTNLWLWLAKTRRRICAQIHTHPGPAFHSKTDDLHPIIHVPGFVSIVVPDFARGPALRRSYVAEIDESGGWRKRAPNLVRIR